MFEFIFLFLFLSCVFSCYVLWHFFCTLSTANILTRQTEKETCLRALTRWKKYYKMPNSIAKIQIINNKYENALYLLQQLFDSQNDIVITSPAETLVILVREKKNTFYFIATHSMILHFMITTMMLKMWKEKKSKEKKRKDINECLLYVWYLFDIYLFFFHLLNTLFVCQCFFLFFFWIFFFFILFVFKRLLMHSFCTSSSPHRLLSFSLCLSHYFTIRSWPLFLVGCLYYYWNV